MRLAIVTDEILPDPERAIALGLTWRIRDFELRRVWDRRVPDLTASQIAHLRSLRDARDIRYTALSPGVFKQPLEHPRTEQDIVERLPRTLDLARTLGVSKIIVFGFPRSSQDPIDGRDRVIGCLRRAATIAADAGMLLCLEPERDFWCSTGAETAATVRSVGLPALRVNWDPGNCAAAGEPPYPGGYAFVRGLVAHVHVKDYQPAPDGQFGRWVAPGDGVIDWAGQIGALVADGIDRLTVETHFTPAVEGSRLSVERLRGYLRAAGEVPS